MSAFSFCPDPFSQEPPPKAAMPVFAAEFPRTSSFRGVDRGGFADRVRDSALGETRERNFATQDAILVHVVGNIQLDFPYAGTGRSIWTA